jgi:hypothetical protein
LVATTFHEDFDGVSPIFSTGSVVDDVRHLAIWFRGAEEELRCGTMGEFLSEDEPFEDLRRAAASLAVVRLDLLKQGFCPPDLHHAREPLQFIEANAAFLCAIEGVVIEPDVSVN